MFFEEDIVPIEKFPCCLRNTVEVAWQTFSSLTSRDLDYFDDSRVDERFQMLVDGGSVEPCREFQFLHRREVLRVCDDVCYDVSP